MKLGARVEWDEEFKTILRRIANALESIATETKEERVREAKAKAGRESARIRREVYGTALPPARGEHPPLAVESRTNPNTLEHKPEQNPNTLESNSGVTHTNPVAHLYAVYIKCWQARYKTDKRPALTKAFQIFKMLLRERSVEEIAQLLQVYCQMNDKWFVTKHHDIVTFNENIGKVVMALDRGVEREGNQKDWKEIVKERGL